MQQVAGKWSMVVGWVLVFGSIALAQEPGVHYYHQGTLPPGAIGSQQLQRGGPLSGYYQPVEIKAPCGANIALTVEGQFDSPQKGARHVGLLIGSVYRLCVTNIPLAEGQEVFPTIEVVDRLFTPIGQENRFPIPIELAEEDLKLALAGKFVTRIIYLEDPRNALPIRENPQQQTWFEASVGQDPLAIADGLGRPVAILRMGGRVPVAQSGDDSRFFFGSPSFVEFTPPSLPVERTAAVHVEKSTTVPAKNAARSTIKKSASSITPSTTSVSLKNQEYSTKNPSELVPLKNARPLPRGSQERPPVKPAKERSVDPDPTSKDFDVLDRAPEKSGLIPTNPARDSSTEIKASFVEKKTPSTSDPQVKLLAPPPGR